MSMIAERTQHLLPATHDSEIAAQSATNFEIDPMTLLSIAWRRKWLTIFSLFLAFALGTLYYFQKRPEYESKAQLMIVKNETKLEGTRMDSMAEHQTLVSKDLLSTQMVVIKSRGIVGAAIQAAGLDKLDSLQLQVKGDEDLTTTIIKHMELEKGGDDSNAGDASTVTISYRGFDPEHCKLVVDAIIASYLVFLGDSSRNVGVEAIQLIQRAKDDLNIQLRQKEDGYHKFLKSTELLLGSKRETGQALANMHTMRMLLIEEKRSELQLRYIDAKSHLVQLDKALKDGVTREALLYKIQRSGGARKSDVIGATESNLEQELTALQIKRAKLLGKQGRRHPDVLVVDGQINEIRTMMRGAVPKDSAGEEPGDYLKMYLDGVRHEIQEMEAQEKDLSAAFDKEKADAKSLLNEELQEQQLRNELTRMERLYETVVDRLQAINIVKDYGAYNTQVIAPAELGIKVAPRLWLVCAVAMFMGLCGGAGLTFLVESSDQSFHSPEEIRERLGLPILGEIPFASGELAQKANSDSAVDASICSYHRPKARISEAYRAVRTALYFSSHGEGHKLIQVTSASPGDGKSTLAVNLAVSIAQSGMKVLLIDADMRRPRLHKLVGLPDEAIGISSVIGGQADAADAIHATEIENLWCMPCGLTPSNPSELLSLPRFKDLLDRMRSRYDFVIVDTPPLLVVTDPSAVAPRVDGVLLTVRLKKNARPDAVRAVTELSSLGAKVLGVVINAVQSGGRYNSYGAAAHGYGDMGNDGDERSVYCADDSLEMKPISPQHRLRNG